MEKGDIESGGFSPERLDLISKIKKLVEMDLYVRLYIFFDKKSDEVLAQDNDGYWSDASLLKELKVDFEDDMEDIFTMIRGDRFKSYDDYEQVRLKIVDILETDSLSNVNEIIDSICSDEIIDLLIGDETPEDIENNFRDYAHDTSDFNLEGVDYFDFDMRRPGVVNLHLNAVFLENPHRLFSILRKELGIIANSIRDSGYRIGKKNKKVRKIRMDSWIVQEREVLFRGLGFKVKKHKGPQYFHNPYNYAVAKISVEDFVKIFGSKTRNQSS